MCRLIEFIFHLDSKTCNTCMHPWIIYIHGKLILLSDGRLALQPKAGLYRSNSFLFHFEKWSQHVDSILIYSILLRALEKAGHRFLEETSQIYV